MPRWLGDAVHASPALAALRGAGGIEAVDLVAPEAHGAYFKALGWTNALLPREDKDLVSRIKRGSYAVGILFPKSFRSAWTLWRSGIKVRIGVPAEGRSFFLTHKVRWPLDRSSPLRLEYLELARTAGAATPPSDPYALLKAHFPGRKSKGLRSVAIHPGAAYGRSKVWALENYAALARGLASRGIRVLALGGKSEAESCRRVAEAGRGENAAGLTDLQGTMDLLSMADVVVGGDSGPLHLASALGRPVVGLYGSTSPAWTPPTGNKSLVLWGKTACGPCFRRDCAVGFRCLNLITVDAVLSAVLRQLPSGKV